MLLSLTVYLPGLITIAPVDRDESRFAQASRQMLESVALPASERDPALHDGGLAVPKVGDKLRLNKPPLIYWLQAGSAALFTAGDPLSDAIWMYRVPSVLAAIVAVLATWRMGLVLFDPRAAWLGALFLAWCPMVVWDAHQARADQLLLACTTVAGWGLARLWTRAGDSGRPDFTAVLLLWLGVGLGVLAKGPITPMIVLLTAAALSWWSGSLRWIVRTRPLLGVVFVVLIVTPWVVLIAQRIGLGTYWDLVYDETIGRSGSAKEGHWGPPGYHFVMLGILLWPGSLFTLIGLIRAALVGLRPGASGRLSRLRRGIAGRRSELFCLAWIAPAWIVFELVSTKLPHYTLPLYPVIALLTARALLAAIARQQAVPLALRMLWTAVGLGGSAATIAMLSITEPPIAIKVTGIVLCVLVVGAVLFAGRLFAAGVLLRAQLIGLVAAAVLWATAVGLGAPSLVSVSRDAMAIAGDRPLGAIAYQEDSLRFWTRGRLKGLGPDTAAAWLDETSGGVVLTTLPLLDETMAGLPGARILGRVEGFNYSKGEQVELILLERGPDLDLEPDRVPSGEPAP